MKSRRAFIKIGTGAAFSAFAFSSAAKQITKMSIPTATSETKNIIIGIIGAENSHSIDFCKAFNIEGQYPGVRVEYIWGETEELAQIAMKKGEIPYMVKSPEEMLGKINALIVDHRHGKYHLEAALPFIKAGVPTFIDKPFCYRVEEGKKFFQTAKEYGTPVTSYSSIAHNEVILKDQEQIKELGEISNVVMFGSLDIDSPYGGIFFYGMHMIQPLTYLFGNNVKKVKVTKEEDKGCINLVFENGMLATLIRNTLHYGWEMFVETKDGIKTIETERNYTGNNKYFDDIVEMFKTGKEPRKYQDILNEVSILEAMEKSVESEQWEHVKYVSI